MHINFYRSGYELIDVARNRWEGLEFAGVEVEESIHALVRRRELIFGIDELTFFVAVASSPKEGDT